MERYDIFEAIEANRIEALKAIINKYPEVLFSKDGNGDTPALVATRNDRFECLKIIAEKAPQTLGGWEVISEAAAVCSIRCLKIIAEKAPEALSAVANSPGRFFSFGLSAGLDKNGGGIYENL